MKLFAVPGKGDYCKNGPALPSLRFLQQSPKEDGSFLYAIPPTRGAAIIFFAREICPARRRYRLFPPRWLGLRKDSMFVLLASVAVRWFRGGQRCLCIMEMFVHNGDVIAALSPPPWRTLQAGAGRGAKPPFAASSRRGGPRPALSAFLPVSSCARLRRARQKTGSRPHASLSLRCAAPRSGRAVTAGAVFFPMRLPPQTP